MSDFIATGRHGQRESNGDAGSVGIVLLILATWCLLTGPAHSASLGPQELFELGGIGKEQLAGLAENEVWQAADKDIVRRMLYRIEKDVRPADLESWSLGNADLDRLGEDSEAYRLQVFQLRGRVLSVERYPLSLKEDDAGEFAMIWRCRMQLDSDERSVEVFAAQVPEAWSIGKPIDEPAGARAFFLKTLASEGTGPAACFLTDRMAWYPPTYLGRLGMDVGLLDDVVVAAPPKQKAGASPQVSRASRQLTESDHECFYQMLKAAGSAKAGQLSRWAEEELAETGESSFSVVPLFLQPQAQQGQLVELTGVARRIVPVRVSEEDVNDRIGIKEYYQVYLFTEDSQNNPVVFCLRELPEGLPMGDGPGFSETLSVPGFFFKTWSYPVQSTVPAGKPQRQLAPLLIGKTAVWYPAQAPTGLSPTLRLIGTVVLLAVLGVVWWIFRQFARGDREFTRRIRRRVPAEVSQTDWNTLDASGEGDS